MRIEFHSHALYRIKERGTSQEEVIGTIENGTSLPARLNRTYFTKEYDFNNEWNLKFYLKKNVEVIAVREEWGWLVLTVIVKFY